MIIASNALLTSRLRSWWRLAPLQFDGFAMRSVTVGLGPGLFTLQHRVSIRQALGQDQALQRRQPMLVVARAVVGLASIGSLPELASQRGGPLFPGEVT